MHGSVVAIAVLPQAIIFVVLSGIVGAYAYFRYRKRKKALERSARERSHGERGGGDVVLVTAAAMVAMVILVAVAPAVAGVMHVVCNCSLGGYGQVCDEAHAAQVQAHPKGEAQRQKQEEKALC